jgi:hypothetical protein
MQKKNEKHPKSRNQRNKRGPSMKKRKGKKAVKRNKRKREHGSSTYTDESLQKSDSDNMDEDDFLCGLQWLFLCKRRSEL